VAGAMKGITVLEVGQGVGVAVAGMILADFGAHVSRLAASGSEPADDNPGFVMWHRNKRLLSSPSRAEDRSRLLDGLLSSVDLCIIGAGCPEIEVDLQALSARHPQTVFLVMPPYWGEAPWEGQAESSELIGAVMGLAMRQSSREDGPVDSVYPHVAYVHGMWAAACAVAALLERESSGLGQAVTVSGMHAALVTGTATFVVDPYGAETTSTVGPGGTNPLYTRYECQDGRWLFLGGLTAKFQQRALEVLGLEDVGTDERLGGALDRVVLPENRDWVRERIAARFRTRTRQDWLERLEAADCPAGPVMSRDEWLDHPQIRAIGMRAELEDPQRGTVVMPGVPLTLTRSPGEVRALEQPAGRPTDVAGHAASPSGSGPREPVAAGGKGPLAGVRVLNLGTVLAGPFSGCLLSELGADVTKVEPLAGDPFRTRGFVYNRGMRSIAVDLRSPTGRKAFDRLVRETDVVIDNFRPGVLRRLGIDYESLRRTNPDVVSFSMTGFGDCGPLFERPGFDPILQAMSGMMTAQGGADEPVFLTVAVNDIAGGVIGALATCLGLLHRARRGEGQAMWSSLAAMSVFMPSDLGELLEAGRSPSGTPVTSEELVKRLSERGIAAVPARRAAELVDDPRLVAAGAFHEHRRADGRPFFTPGRLAHFSRTQEVSTLIPPGLGEHTRDVLARAGLSDLEVDALIAEGAVVSGEPFRVEELVAYR
jgi:crotonobetainyl-CoA:carnitine CoA-transferase CaiB-like acyl-CoA transferase